MLNIHNRFRKQISYLLLPGMMIFTFSAFAPLSYGSVDHLDSFDKQKTVSENNKIEFYYNNGKIIDESDGTNISSYLIARHRILRSVNSKNQWLITNGKDVVATTDGSGSGNGTALSNYTPYGQSIDFRSGILNNQSNIQNPTSNINTNPFKYSGYYSDAESGLYYLSARFYSPELMRFINRDTYDLSNRYAYCDGDPISQTDPTGHSTETWLKRWGLTIGGTLLGVGFAVFSGGNTLILGLGIGAAVVGGTGQGLVAGRVIKQGSDLYEGVKWGSLGLSAAMDIAALSVIGFRAAEYSVGCYNTPGGFTEGDHVFVDMDKTLVRRVSSGAELSDSDARVFTKLNNSLKHTKYAIGTDCDVYINDTLKTEMEEWMHRGINVHILSTGGWEETTARALFNRQLASFNNWDSLVERKYASDGLGKLMSKGRAINKILQSQPAWSDNVVTTALLDDQWHQRWGAMMNKFYSGDVRGF